MALRQFSRCLSTSSTPMLTRCLSTSPALDKFTSAQDKLKTLSPPNDAKLRLYGLFKQANSGQCNIKKPSSFNMVARAKYESWSRLGSMSPEEARAQYVQLIEGMGDPVVEEGTGLEITNDKAKGVTTLRLNRPHKSNALTWDMFRTIGDALNEAAQDEECRVLVLTGTGEWYSSGNDLDNFSKLTPDGRVTGSKESSVLKEDRKPTGVEALAGSSEAEQLINHFMTACITFPKPLIAAVNGPAIGIPVSSLGFCDLVYCVQRATFMTPFVSLGQSPEACSSYTFPRIMGFGKASEMLLTEREFSSQEALRAGLVTRVLEEDGFLKEVTSIAEHIASLPPQSMKISKALIRGGELETKLLSVNQRELETLRERVLSEECRTAVMAFLMKNKG